MIQHTQQLLTRLEKSYVTWMLLGIALIFFLLRLPSLFEPYWYGDEGIYQAIGDSIRHGKILYVETWDNKPPLLYVVYALFSSDQFSIRLASTIGGLISVLLIFLLARLLFNKDYIALIVASIFTILYGTPFIEGIIANAENFIMVFVLAAAFLLYKLTTSEYISNALIKSGQIPLYSLQVPRRGVLFTVGFLVGVGFLFKIVAIFDLLAFLFFLYLFNIYEQRRFIIPMTFVNQAKIVIIGFLIPFILSTLYFLFNNALADYIHGAFFSNIGYVNYGNKLIIPQGLLVIKIALLVVALVTIAKMRKHFNLAELFILSWFVFSLFNAYFSQRPYTHYLLVILPSFTLLLGLCFTQNKKRMLYIAMLLITSIFLLRDFDYFSTKKLHLYYGNFYQFASGQKSTRAYQSFFDGNTPKYYDVATFLKSHTTPSEPVFIWGNAAQIYVLSDTLHTGRYTVAYHITGRKDAVSETNNAIEKDKPRFIVLFEQPSLPDINLHDYNYKLSIDNVRIYERIP
jgi:4-amino-4-deoxy-L-arabinose transferase-like glycosyltransferase